MTLEQIEAATDVELAHAVLGAMGYEPEDSVGWWSPDGRTVTAADLAGSVDTLLAELGPWMEARGWFELLWGGGREATVGWYHRDSDTIYTAACRNPTDPPTRAARLLRTAATAIWRAGQ